MAAGYVVAGLGLGLAANLRPAYIPALVVAVLVVGLRPLLRELGRRIVAVALVLVGAILITVPQSLINHHQAGTWTPTPRGSHDVSLVQLSAGLIAQRYETFVGPRDEYPRARLFYVDPAGWRVLQDEGIDGVSNYRQYLRVVVHHPLLMGTSYGLHLFNGLDVWYPTPYVRHLSDRSPLLSLLQYALLFVAIALLAVREARRMLGQIDWGAIAILLSPCVISITGAVEPRFFLPAYALVYLLVCFGPGPRQSLWSRGVHRRLALAASLAAFVAVCVALSAATRTQIDHRPSKPAPVTAQAFR
jgi:hypothetical protein